MIKLNNLSFKFDRKQIFQNFNLHIPKGESCLITGINGVGTSTLLRLMAGALRPDSGEVKYGEALGIRPKKKSGSYQTV